MKYQVIGELLQDKDLNLYFKITKELIGQHEIHSIRTYSRVLNLGNIKEKEMM